MLLTDQKLREMSDAIDARLDPNMVWDSNQRADALAAAGYSDQEIDHYLEENAPF
jgi:hypothetical protein